jgi:hypothetical protein
MENIMQLWESLFKGIPSEWLFTKFFTAFVGGCTAYFYKYHFNLKPGETHYKFFWRGFWFSIFSAIGGIFLLAPINAFNAYATGLIGWIAIEKMLKRENTGASNPSLDNGVLTIEDLIKMYGENQK